MTMTNMAFQVHINKRVKTNDKIQLPIDALLEQYQDQSVSSFVQSKYFIVLYQARCQHSFVRIQVQQNFSNVLSHVLCRFYYHLHQNGVSKSTIRS